MTWGIPVRELNDAREVIEHVRATKRIFAEKEAKARLEEARARDAKAAAIREQEARLREAQREKELQALQEGETIKLARDYILVATPEESAGREPERILVKRPLPSPSRLRRFIAKAERHYRLRKGDVCGGRRFAEIMKVRVYCVHLVGRLRPDWSLSQLGRFFGGRDHTTILHTLRKFNGARPQWTPPAWKGKP